MKNAVTLALVVIAGSALGALPASAQYYFVDDTAVGANDGGSWENAFNELQEAIHLAQPGEVILVAEGTYWPDWNPVTDSITGNRADTFQLKNGVALLGGFPDAGGWGYRDPSTFMTILTGDINAPLYNTDNSYHVVTAGAGVGNTALLDGFFVWSGFADGAYPHERGAGILLSGSSPVLRQVQVQWSEASAAGGGIYNEGGAPLLENVTIAYNRAGFGGGGMWNQGGSPHLTDAFFLFNGATGEGGGLFTQGGTPQIERSRFVDNFGTRGGGIASWPGTSLALNSVELRGNWATNDIGGGIFNWVGLLDLNNVTLSGNTAPVEGGGLYLFNPNTVTIRNSIVWGNTGGNVNGAIATVSDSVMEGGYPGTNILSADPLFRTPGSDLRLKRGSSALDAGDPATCGGSDVRGVLRAAACELGAYEYRGNPGTFWTNGEMDLLHGGHSFDATPIDGVIRQSADDFVVPSGMVCDVSGFRGVLLDSTKVVDARAELFSSSGTELASWWAQAYCADDPQLTCAGNADCPTGSCVLPGQLLAEQSNGKIWEPRFDYIGMRLSPGTYWLSIFGTIEPTPEGGGFAAAISAGDGAIQSNPYHFREVGFGWVNGGPFFGDVSRDLALDVDAVCLVDADGDRSEAGVDCNDNDPDLFPGNTESCDTIDNNCDGVADTGLPPVGVPTLQMDRTQISWNAVPNAIAYDVVRGEISELRVTGGDFTTAACNEDDVVGTTFEISGGMPHGLGLWYVIRAVSPCGVTTYDSGSHQVQSRDAEIVAGGNACP